jgi:hypothetical protein
MQVKLSRSGFPTVSDWHTLIKDKVGTERLRFPKMLLVIGQQLSTVAVLQCFVQAVESLTQVSTEYTKGQLEEVCLLIWLEPKECTCVLT